MNKSVNGVLNGKEPALPKKPVVKAPAKAAAKPVAKAAVKPAAPKAAVKPVATKAVPKAAAKPAAAKVAPKAAAKAAPKAVPKAAAKPAPKAAAKPAAKAAPKAAAKPAPKAAPKAAAAKPAPVDAAKDKTRKEKLVRDSFTMPEQEYAVLGQVKKACLKAGFEIKKSELLRIGVALISQIDLATLQNVLAGLPQLKTGRPKKA
ncbi:hypothetical protein [Duganella violaceipulchra]|uniref:Type II secretory pathway component HofQ n=1 Tax=Duganella violaceipulchra TaxID=2849652 RepID=A0AA41L2W2_9BURK|nr:hypothetical protein [Duganella violaceicalia]MBV6323113.1 hypothetical protein [Duganella violaceicalia]MCP2010101.1 type II secretory pathway component HofQ [Duganella violaceicalia]